MLSIIQMASSFGLNSKRNNGGVCLKKGKILGLMAMSAVLLAGCADAMPELTEEQNRLIV